MKQGWEIKKLGEVCEINLGKTPPRSDARMWDKERQSKNIWLSIADLNSAEGGYVNDSKEYISDEAKQNIKIVKKGTLLLSFKLTLGKTAFAGTDLYTNEAIAALPFKDKSLNKFFLKYYFESFDWQKFASGDEKVLGKTLNKKKLDIIPIPVPSLLEQGRIVEVLDAAFAKIDALKENAQKNLENAKALFQQVLKQELTPKPNWQTKKLGEIALKKLSYGASVPSRNFDGEYRYIRITDIDEDGKLLNDLVSPAVCEEKHILHSGDFLLARTGGTIGKSYLYSPEDGKCIYAGYLIRVIVNQDIVLPEFVFFNTKTDRYWNFIKKSQKTAAQPNINAQQYSSFDIPYPSKDEQEGIVRKIKSIFTKQKQLEKCCQKTIAECDALKQAVLRRAFNGEL